MASPKVAADQMEKEEDQESFSNAMQLATSSVLCMSLQSAIELGDFDIIAKAGEGSKLSPAEIAAQMGSSNPEAPIMLDRMLRMLASHSVLSCSLVGDDKEPTFQRLYSLSNVSKHFVTNEDGVSFGPGMMALLQDKMCLDSWPQHKYAILEGGIPFNRAHGTNPFEYLGSNPRLNLVFNTAMYNETTIVVKNLLKFYNGFNHLKQLVDVAGGLGVALNVIISKYPRLKGINFDLPQVIDHAISYPGVEHLGGDMFDRSILHGWNDERCLKLLKNRYKAIPNNGKAISVESILPIKPETNSAEKSISQKDVLMMTQNPGGKERSQQEFLALATGSGFSGIKFKCLDGVFWIMEFFK